MQILKWLLSAGLIFTVVACTTDESEPVPDIEPSNQVSTRDMYATFQVLADGSGEIYSEAQLTRGVPPINAEDEETFVRLVSGDELWFSRGESASDISIEGDLFSAFEGLTRTHQLFESSESGTAEVNTFFLFVFVRTIINDFGTWYSAVLPEEDEDDLYYVTLTRNGRGGDVASSVRLPMNFSIISPRSGQTYSRSQDDIIVEWNNTEPSTSTEIEVNISCSNGGRFSYSDFLDTDSGTHTISAGTLDIPSLAGICSATLNLRKIKIGNLNSRFIGGRIDGYQVRSTVFLSNS